MAESWKEQENESEEPAEEHRPSHSELAIVLLGFREDSQMEIERREDLGRERVILSDCAAAAWPQS